MSYRPPALVRSSSTQSSAGSKRARASSDPKARRKVVQRKPVAVSLGRQPFPKQLKNTLKYCEEIGVTLDVNGISEYLFSCNGMTQPNVTLANHQPLYFDQLVAVYNHYTVQTSRIKVIPLYSAYASPIIYVLMKDDDATTGTTTNTNLAREREGSVTAVAQPNDWAPPVLRSSWSVRATFGNDGMGDSALQGTVAASPTERTVWCVHLDGGVAGGTAIIHYLIEIEYDCVWDERVSITTS